MDAITTRRALLGTIALAPAIGAIPAIAIAGPSPFRIAEARYKAAVARFEALPHDLEDTDRAQFAREERLLIDASRVVEAAPVRDWQEYADLFAIACDDGLSVVMQDTMHKLFADAQRLAGRA